MMEIRQVAVLFARADSIYKTLPGCDVWDIDRDARKWPGGAPIVGHPPCRAWGGLRHMAKPRPDEKALATWCVDQIRKWGGCLNILRAPHFGLSMGFLSPMSVIGGVDSQLLRLSFGGGIWQRKPRAFIYVVAN